MTEIILEINDFVWGPAMLILMVGTSIFLTIRLKFRPWRNLGYGIRSSVSRESRGENGGDGDVSPFSALATSLAATIGTGNIVGVATAMVAGGPGALVWMWISACFGISSQFAECMLAVKYREVNEKGEISGGPMYTMKKGFKNKRLGAMLGMIFAVFAVIASFGIGNMTQANSISEALKNTFEVPEYMTGVVFTILALLVIVGGIKSISKVATIVVPAMAGFYMIACLIVIIVNIENLPGGIAMIFEMAFNPRAVGGGLCGSITAGAMKAMRYGIARGVFSNEAGMGSSAISAAAATTDNPVRQGYISMTGTFWDTIVVCTMTGLCIATSGALGTSGDSTGSELLQGCALVIEIFSQAFERINENLGSLGEALVTIGIILFAFATIISWEYHGEKAFEYVMGTHKFNMIYRIAFSLVVYVGATQSLQLVWGLSDIANALMAVPNLICLLALSNVVVKETERFHKM